MELLLKAILDDCKFVLTPESYWLNVKLSNNNGDNLSEPIGLHVHATDTPANGDSATVQRMQL